MTRIAGILINVVPYHHARWEAFAQHSGMDCQLFELTDRDVFRVLETGASGRYRRKTLFPGLGHASISTRHIYRRLGTALDESRPEVVCISGYAFKASLCALEWAIRRRIPVVLFSESNEHDESRSRFKEFTKKRLVSLCSSALAGGSSSKAYLLKLGIAHSQVFVGYDTVDNQHFKARATEYRTCSGNGRNRQELPASYFVVCSRFVEKKNLCRVVHAYARYRASSFTLQAQGVRRDTWDLVLVGDGEQRREIESTIASLRVGESVHLVGARSYAETPRYYALAGAFIYASTTEQWGLAVNEAMASGLPVLVSNRCGCAPDLVEEGINGFTFDPHDTEELSELMLKVSAPDFPRASFGTASERIIAGWGLDLFAQELSKAVEAALTAAPRAQAGWFDRALLWGLIRRPHV